MKEWHVERTRTHGAGERGGVGGASGVGLGEFCRHVSGFAGWVSEPWWESDGGNGRAGEGVESWVGEKRAAEEWRGERGWFEFGKWKG